MADQSMPVKQVQTERGAMEAVIREAILTFETRTGCFVKQVNIERIFIIDQPALLGAIKTEIHL